MDAQNTQTHKHAHIHIIGASYLEKSRRIASIFVLGTPLNKFPPALPGARGSGFPL